MKRLLPILLLVFSVGANSPSVATDPFDDAMAAYRSQDHKLACRLFLPDAEGGHHIAQRMMGA